MDSNVTREARHENVTLATAAISLLLGGPFAFPVCNAAEGAP